MAEPAGLLPSSPYTELLDPERLGKLEKRYPGSIERIFDLVANDRADIARAQFLAAEREHKLRLLATTVTMITVLAIASMATLVIMGGHNAAGSILATVDLVALANVLVNSGRR